MRFFEVIRCWAGVISVFSRNRNGLTVDTRRLPKDAGTFHCFMTPERARQVGNGGARRMWWVQPACNSGQARFSHGGELQADGHTEVGYGRTEHETHTGQFDLAGGANQVCRRRERLEDRFLLKRGAQVRRTECALIQTLGEKRFSCLRFRFSDSRASGGELFFREFLVDEVRTNHSSRSLMCVRKAIAG
jgi:hypothetical protein